jgi:allophanate hydrolase subunit 2
VVRILPGPDATDELLAGLVERTWEVSPSSDRRGARLVGDPLPSPGDGQRLSLGVLPGTIQLSPDGQPIILLADAQPTGGYPVIGVAIEADVPVAGQLAAAEEVTFALVDLAASRDASRAIRDFPAFQRRDRTPS